MNYDDDASTVMDDEMDLGLAADDYSQDSHETSTAPHHPNKNKKLLEERGKFRVWRTNRTRQRVPVDMYVTRYNPGSRIRHAITGCYEQALVGKSDEYAFFKVGWNTGELGKEAMSTTLFFDSPEQFERHTHTVLPAGVKQTWHARHTV